MIKYLFLIVIFLIDRYLKDFATIPKTINYNFSFNLSLNALIFIVLIIILSFGFWYLDFINIFIKNKIGASFVIFGGLSNLIDRYIYGGVVDYLDFFGVLKNNLADYLIVIGLILTIYTLFFRPKNIQ